MIFILILVIILFMIYFMPIHVKLEAKRDDQCDSVIVRLHTLYGLLKLKTEVPFINLTIEDNKLVVKYKTRVKSAKTNKLKMYFDKMMTPREMKNSLSFLKNGLHYKKAFAYLISKTKVRSLRFNLTFGVGDAALTGMLVGFSWIILGSILSLLFAYVNTTAERITVNPSFDKTTFRLELGCIIHVKLGHIIITGIRMLILYRQFSKTESAALSG